jgi:hypothetical protein
MLKQPETLCFRGLSASQGRTARPFESNGYIIKKRSSESTVMSLVDCLPHKWRAFRGLLQLPTQKHPVSVQKTELGGGPSAHHDRTVRLHYGTPSRAQNDSVRSQTS